MPNTLSSQNPKKLQISHCLSKLSLALIQLILLFLTSLSYTRTQYSDHHSNLPLHCGTKITTGHYVSTTSGGKEVWMPGNGQLITKGPYKPFLGLMPAKLLLKQLVSQGTKPFPKSSRWSCLALLQKNVQKQALCQPQHFPLKQAAN